MIPIFTAVSAAACGKPRASGDDPDGEALFMRCQA